MQVLDVMTACRFQIRLCDTHSSTADHSTTAACQTACPFWQLPACQLPALVLVGLQLACLLQQLAA